MTATLTDQFVDPTTSLTKTLVLAKELMSKSVIKADVTEKLTIDLLVLTNGTTI